MTIWESVKGILKGRKTMTQFVTVQLILVVNLAMDVPESVAVRCTWALVAVSGLYMIANAIKGYYKGRKKA